MGWTDVSPKLPEKEITTDIDPCIERADAGTLLTI